MHTTYGDFYPQHYYAAKFIFLTRILKRTFLKGNLNTKRLLPSGKHLWFVQKKLGEKYPSYPSQMKVNKDTILEYQAIKPSGSGEFQ